MEEMFEFWERARSYSGLQIILNFQGSHFQCIFNYSYFLLTSSPHLHETCITSFSKLFILLVLSANSSEVRASRKHFSWSPDFHEL